MYLIVYVSTAVELFSDSQLDSLIEKSCENNAKTDITGILLYRDGNFMQFLEGPKENVLALLAKIKIDPRHKGVIILLQDEHPERHFDECPMLFKKLNAHEVFKLEGYGNFLNLPLTSEEFLLNPSKALRLLLNFRKDVPGSLHRAAAAEQM